MDRFVVLPVARRLRPLLLPSSTSRRSVTSAASASHALTLLENISPPASQRQPLDGDDTAARLWSALEETELPSGSKVSRPSQSDQTSPSATSTVFSEAKSVEELDAKWQELSKDADTRIPVETLLQRSLALARLSRTRKDSISVLEAFSALEKTASVELTGQTLVATAEALLRCGMNAKAAQIIEDYRAKHGSELLDRRAYAIIIAASLELPGIPAMSESRESGEPMDATSESAFRTALRYFKGLLGGQSLQSTSGFTPMEQAPIASSAREGEGVIRALEMLQEDQAKGNVHAVLSQELFEEVLLLSPAKAPQIADAMRAAGFTPTKTSFLASLFGAMKQADASRAVNLLGEMHEMNVERTEMHYIATAAALKRRAQMVLEADKATTIKPWYFRTVLDEYLKDMPSGSVNSEFATAIVLGMCSSRSADQEIVPEMQAVLETLKARRATVDGEAFGMLMSRLSVTKGELNLLRICEWMREVGAKRDRHINNGFLCYYAEALVKNARSQEKFARDKDESRLTEAQTKQRVIMGYVEALVSEMIGRSPEQQQLLRQTSALLLRGAEPEDGGDVTVDCFAFKPVEEEAEGVDDRTFQLLARAYGHAGESAKLRKLTGSLRKDKYVPVDFAALDLALIRALGKEGRVEEAIEVSAEVQSRGDKITPELVDVFADHVFIRNNRLADAVAYALGLCRTYRVRPDLETLFKLRRKALRDENKEEGDRIDGLFEEFDYGRELHSRKRLDTSAKGKKRAHQ